MTKTACDICHVEGVPLTELRDCYQLADVKEICGCCEGLINRAHHKMQVIGQKMLEGNLKWMIRELFNKHIQRSTERTKS
jgi:hypothetical protein